MEQFGPISEKAIAAYISHARRGPRLKEMFASFSRIAAGTDGVPETLVSIDRQLLGFDDAALRYSATRQRYAGPFNVHFVASVPYALEEQCRLGAGLLDFCLEHSKDASLYTLGDGAGVTARTVASISNGRIRTLNCSPNPENYLDFMRNRPDASYFFSGPFFDLTTDVRKRMARGSFEEGFDVIIEDTTFQMYGKERAQPIALAHRHLKPDGVLLLIEKLSQPDPREFIRRERQKDTEFKSRYFPREEIAKKRNAIVSQMDRHLVTLEELAESVALYFSNAIITWNSGNFYTLAASNCDSRLRRFTGALIAPAVPREFLYEALPRCVVAPASDGGLDGPYHFRQSKR